MHNIREKIRPTLNKVLSFFLFVAIVFLTIQTGRAESLDDENLQVSATSSKVFIEEIPPAEKFVKKQSLLTNLFGAFFDLLSEEDNLSESTEADQAGRAESLDDENLQVSATSSEVFIEEIPPAEKSVKKQSLLTNLFGAFFDLLSEEDNLSESTGAEDKIFEEKISGNVRVAAVVRNSKAELWTEDIDKKEWQKIANEEMISENSPVSFEDNIILWLSPDQKAVVGLDTLSQVYFSQTIEPWGDTIIEFNAQKYILLIQNNNITIIPQIIDENSF